MKTTRLSQLEREAGAEERAVPCPACGGARFEVLLTPGQMEAERRWLRAFHGRRVRSPEAAPEDRTEFTQSEPTNLVRCLSCSTLLRSPRPDPDRLRALYEDDEYSEGALDSLAENQDALFRAKARSYAPLLPAGARVLEIGPFVGGFLTAARERGWRATGVDVGEQTTSFMRRRGLDVLHGELLEVDLPERAWDGIFVWNTFDQMDDPAPVLNRCRELIRPGGILALRIPNGAFETEALRLRRQSHGSHRAERVLLAQAWNNFLFFPYLAGYPPDALAALLERHGFRVERTDDDVLVTLCDEDSLPCAVKEERRVKRATLRAARAVRRAAGRIVAPWLDVYARAAGD